MAASRGWIFWRFPKVQSHFFVHIWRFPKVSKVMGGTPSHVFFFFFGFFINHPFMGNPVGDMGVSTVMEDPPIAGWFIMENPIDKWMIYGYPHFCRNLHTHTYIYIYTHTYTYTCTCTCTHIDHTHIYHTHIHTIHIQIHIRIHIYIYIYAQRLGFAQALQRRGFPFTNK